MRSYFWQRHDPLPSPLPFTLFALLSLSSSPFNVKGDISTWYGLQCLECVVVVMVVVIVIVVVTIVLMVVVVVVVVS